MENELLSVISGLLIFLGIIIFYRFFGKAGMFIWMGMAIIIANIQVMETISVFGFVTAMGNIIYGTTFLCTDILSENHGKKEARKAVMVGFFVLFFFTTIMQITLMLIPDASDTMHPALKQIFSFLPRITFASLSAYLVSQFFDVWMFERIRAATKGKLLWLRNNIATMLAQLLDNIIFTWIAFVGLFGLFGWEQVFTFEIIWQIFFTSLVIKYVVAICDTPFVYLAVWMKKKGMVRE